MKDLKWTSGNELKYVTEVLENRHKNNPFCNRLEEAIAKKYGVDYVVAVNSGTSAIHAALVACNVGKGDEVITTPFTVFVDGSIPIIVGATPVFADIDFNTHNISPSSIADRITDKTKAIIPVSYHGLPYDIDAIMDIANKYNLYVIGDHVQAQIAKYAGEYVGTKAHMSVLSFERTKHVACGEGGALLTNDAILAERARKFAGMGFKNLTAGTNELAAITPLAFQDPNYKRNDSIGLNYRLPELCAAVALAQFELVDDKVKIRQDIAKLYDKVFNRYTDLIPQTTPIGYTNSYFTYAVKTSFNRTRWLKFHDYLIERGGDDFYGGMGLIYTEPYMVNNGYYHTWNNKCPVAEKVQRSLMQFKTNYRTIEEAKYYINVLDEVLHDFFKTEK